MPRKIQKENEVPADNEYRQYLVDWLLRERAYRKNFPDLYQRVEKFLQDDEATEEQYVNLYREIEGLKPARNTGGRPEEFLQALGAVKVLKAEGKTWKEGRIRGVHDGVHAQAGEVTDDKANPVRYGQRHPSLRFLAERSSSVAWTGWAVQAPSTGR
jgi:hypothetical protein